jgi:hypothetical protein
MDFRGVLQGAAAGVGLIAVSAGLAFLISLNPPVALSVLGVLLVLAMGAIGAIR